MIKVSFALIALICLAACAHTKSPMADAHYEQLSSYRAVTKQCFNSGFVSPQFYAASEQAIDVSLAAWSFDRERLHALTVQAFMATIPNTQICREAEAAGYRGIAKAQELKDNRAAAIAADQQMLDSVNRQNAIRRPIWCNRIGTMTMCN